MIHHNISSCLNCKKEIVSYAKRKYCSSICSGLHKRGHRPGNPANWKHSVDDRKNISLALLGMKRTDNQKHTMSLAQKGRIVTTGTRNKLSVAFTIENPKYSAFHTRKIKRDGHPSTCIDCGKVGEVHNGHWNIERSSNTHKYQCLDELVGRCRHCHRAYDNKLRDCNKEKRL